MVPYLRYNTAKTYYEAVSGVSGSLHSKARLLEQYPDAVGGEMEAAGLYSAASELGTDWIVVKAICDWADGNKSDDHRDLAAAASASLVHEVLSNPHVFNDIK